jgi:hydroxyacylglutathione hydrolase
MEGTHKQMLEAMTKISSLPDSTLIYCTHEYTLANYRFALSLEPKNNALIESNNASQAQRSDNQPTLPTTLSLEKKTNPFLRSHNEALKNQAAQQLNENPANNSIASFSQVRRAKDSFS